MPCRDIWASEQEMADAKALQELHKRNDKLARMLCATLTIMFAGGKKKTT